MFDGQQVASALTSSSSSIYSWVVTRAADVEFFKYLFATLMWMHVRTCVRLPTRLTTRPVKSRTFFVTDKILLTPSVSLLNTLRVHPLTSTRFT